MSKEATSAALERLEALAAEFLEAEIGELEKGNGVTVKDVEVAVIPDTDGDGPFVTVSFIT